jgi:DNA polymerase III gamma/tau subunit
VTSSTSQRRDWLESELERLETLLTPITQRDLAMALALLSSGFPEAEVSPEERKVRAAAYMMALSGQPHSVVNEVVRDAVRGKVANLDMRFMPSSAQLAAVCRDRADSLERQRERIRERLTPRIEKQDPELSNEARARMAARLEALSSTLGASISAEKDGELRKRQERREKLAPFAQKKTGAEAPVDDGGEEA